jgi:2-iminobutanoate/2-iminopropanoate deaminase
MKILETASAPKPIGPYSQAVRAGDLLFISGQIPAIPATGEIARDDIEVQTKQVMENIGAILKAAGLDFRNIVKTTVFMKDLKEFGKFNEIYGTYYKGDFPARATVEVSNLPKGVRIEIEAVASFV